MQIHPGTIQSLPVHEVTPKGYLLGTEHDNVFLPKREVRTALEPGAKVEVFTSYNEERELEATTKLPELQVGQVGCFRVINSNALGAFINIGARRDILIPSREQGESLEDGRMTLVVLCDDPENRRLFASTRLGKFLPNKNIPYKRGDEVSLIIAEKIEIGRRVVIDGKFIGALFRQEMTDKVRLGERVKGYVRKVEGKDITVSMQREGQELLEDTKAKLMAYLEMNGGYVRLNDDTDPEEIKLRLHMSKKGFKKAAGMLFKEGKVLLTKFGIKVNKTGEIPKEWEKNKIFVEDDDPKYVKPLPRKRDEDEDVEKRPLRRSAPYAKPAGDKPDGYKKETGRTPIRKPAAHDASEKKAPARDPEEENAPPKKVLTFKGKK
jgi:uncharacterized protein